MAAHNLHRRYHRSPDLVWNTELAKSAKDVAETCVFKHSNKGYGENLYASSPSSSFKEKAAVDAWYNEIKDYSFDQPGFSSKTGHFTQVVWKETKELGCWLNVCEDLEPMHMKDAAFYVCEYSPPGNVIGRFAENVLSP